MPLCRKKIAELWSWLVSAFGEKLRHTRWWMYLWTPALKICADLNYFWSFASVLCSANYSLALSFSIARHKKYTHAFQPVDEGVKKVTVKANVWPRLLPPPPHRSFINRPPAGFWRWLSKKTIYKFNDSGAFAFRQVCRKMAECRNSTMLLFFINPSQMSAKGWTPRGDVRREKVFRWSQNLPTDKIIIISGCCVMVLLWQHFERRSRGISWSYTSKWSQQ